MYRVYFEVEMLLAEQMGLDRKHFFASPTLNFVLEMPWRPKPGEKVWIDLEGADLIQVEIMTEDNDPMMMIFNSDATLDRIVVCATVSARGWSLLTAWDCAEFNCHDDDLTPDEYAEAVTRMIDQRSEKFKRPKEQEGGENV